MSKKPILTTESGVAVTDSQNSQTAGPGGPALLQDHHLIEKLARFNRERIPERVVHAVGTGAYGYVEVTSPDVPKWTKMRVFENGPSAISPRQTPSSAAASPKVSPPVEIPRPAGRDNAEPPIAGTSAPSVAVSQAKADGTHSPRERSAQRHAAGG